MINFFSLDEQHALVDLPGYGYAKVPEKMKIRWQQTFRQVFRKTSIFTRAYVSDGYSSSP